MKQKPEIKHIPFNKARTSVPLEVEYLSYWQNYVNQTVYNMSTGEDVSNFKRILLNSNYVVLDKYRAAMVAASFITYMGCNCGKSFTLRAEDLYRKLDGFMTREDAYVSVWALENKRELSLNNGVTMMEQIVGRRIFNEKACYGRGAFIQANINKLTVEDIEIINIMVRWWASQDAIEMRNFCTPVAREKTEKILNNAYEDLNFTL